MRGLPARDRSSEVTVCLPAGAPLPADLAARESLRVLAFNGEPLGDRELAGVRFFVPPYRMQPQVAAALPRMVGLEVIQTLTAGVDWLPPSLPSAAVVCNARTAHSVAVAEWVLAAVLTELKRFPLFLRRQSERRWELTPVEAVAGKTVMILGYGHIGEAVAERLRPFGVELIGVARSPRAGVVSLDEARERLREVGVLILLLPLNEETRGLVDADFLGRLEPGALVVNAARGGILDGEALLHELRSGRLRAVLDVTDPEPPPPEHPLWGAPNLTITPHIAAETPDYERRGYELMWAQLRRYLAGERLENVVPRQPAVVQD